MGKNKVKGVITLVLGLIWIIVGLVWLLVSKEAGWIVGGFGGIGVTNIVFSILMMFQPSEEEILEKLKKMDHPGFDKDSVIPDGPKETVQFVAPEDFPEEEPSFDPVTGEPIKK